MLWQGADIKGLRKTTLTFAKVDKKSYAQKYTCKFVYKDLHDHKDEAEVVVRCKFSNSLEHSGVNILLSYGKMG